MIALLTGVTGLVGSHVAIAMLNGGHRIVALARNRQGDSAERRVVKCLGAYPGWQSPASRLADVLTVGGDLLEPGCGVRPPDLDSLRGKVDVILHCAGEVLFVPVAPGSELLRVNTEGVRNILALARELRCPHLVHVSTAYVDQGHGGKGFRTDYERTKLEGEHILIHAASQAGVGLTILRPSIVTGDQIHGFTPTFNGIYPFLGFAADHWPVLRHVPPDRWFPDRFCREATVNLVPGDVVAGAVRAMAESGPSSGPRVLTLINPVEWAIRDLVGTVAGYLQSRFPLTAHHPQAAIDAGTIMRKGELLLGVYEPYMNERLGMVADSENALERIGGLPAFPNRAEWIHALLNGCVGQRRG